MNADKLDRILWKLDEIYDLMKENARPRTRANVPNPYKRMQNPTGGNAFGANRDYPRNRRPRDPDDIPDEATYKRMFDNSKP